MSDTLIRDETAEAEALVKALCQALATTKTPVCHLNLVSLLASGLMMWTPDNRTPLTFEQAEVEAAGLVLQAVTGVMVTITRHTLTDGNDPPQ